MSILTIPDEKTCYDLLQKYCTPNHIVRHSEKVLQVGAVLGEGLLRGCYHVDMDLIKASCLLHDIGKYLCIAEGGGYHDVRGEEILDREGFQSVGHIIVQHVVMRTAKNRPVAEEHVVYYADKRVVHDEVVSLTERFLYLQRTYGKDSTELTFLASMEEEARRVEREIFLLLDFSPDDISELVQLSFSSRNDAVL